MDQQHFKNIYIWDFLLTNILQDFLEYPSHSYFSFYGGWGLRLHFQRFSAGCVNHMVINKAFIRTRKLRKSRTCIAYLKISWCILESYLQPTWGLIEAWLKPTWNLPEAYLKPSWSLHEDFWRLFEAYSKLCTANLDYTRIIIKTYLMHSWGII
jgi:hypothetical protein